MRTEKMIIAQQKEIEQLKGENKLYSSILEGTKQGKIVKENYKLKKEIEQLKEEVQDLEEEGCRADDYEIERIKYGSPKKLKEENKALQGVIEEMKIIIKNVEDGNRKEQREV